MNDAAEYLFRIDAFTPGTIPMKRLAEYMLEVARLLGEFEHVHFKSLRKGSAVVVHRVDYTAIPKVRARLRAATSAAADEDIAKQFRKLDRMLAEDNSSGVLKERGHNGVIIPFPGRAAQRLEIGPIVQEGFVDGQLVRIGGEDNTAHAGLRDGDRIYRCEVSRDVARRLAPHLYGPQLRLIGRGRWRRTEDGIWELIDFKGRDFTVLDDAGLPQIFDRLRPAVDKLLEETPDPVTDLLNIRRGL